MFLELYSIVDANWSATGAHRVRLRSGKKNTAIRMNLGKRVLIREQKTFCRICEAQCGLVVKVEDDSNGHEKIIDIKPNRDHVVSEGYACIKGLKMEDFRMSPDRLIGPLKKIDGEFVSISWKQAIREIGKKLKDIHARYGGEAIATHTGNPIAFSLFPPLILDGLLAAFETDKKFSPASQDCANKFAGAERIYGRPDHQTFPDIDHSNFLILVGSNPKISKMSFINMPRPMERLQAVEERGGKVVWINPRKTESAQTMGQHIAIRPETDVFFMLGFINELISSGGVDADLVSAHMTGFGDIKQLASAWPPERVESVTRVPAATLRKLVAGYAAADGAVMYCSTGVNQTRFGLLTFWLQEVINAVSGNLDRRGGSLVGVPTYSFDMMNGEQKYSRIDDVPYIAGNIPGAILADEILTPGNGKVRAMINVSGNPLMSMPNSDRLAKAFEDLELFVCFDIVRNETAEYADYVLPGLHTLERADIPFYFFSMMGLMPKRYTQFTDAVIAPPEGARDEGLVLYEICAAAGRPLYGSRRLQLLLKLANGMKRLPLLGKSIAFDRLFFDLVAKKAGLGGLKKLRKHPDGMLLDENKPGDYLGQRVATSSGKVELAPTELLARAEQLDMVYNRELANSNALKLIQKRERFSHNSWTHNVTAFVKGQRQTNYLYIHPDDAKPRNLDDGDMAEISANGRSIRVPVKLDPLIMIGTVSVPHGWGHQKANGLTIAQMTMGANVNVILADGSHSIEPISGMAHMNGVLVDVTVCA